MTVADFHTYFVSDLGIWVHNTKCPIKGIPKAASGAMKNFPENPKDMLPGVPSTTTPKGNIKWEPNEQTRIQYHPGDEIKPGETYQPRHHDPHYHVEIRTDVSKGWNNAGNVTKVQPLGYTSGSGTGFLPGEMFPGNWGG